MPKAVVLPSLRQSSGFSPRDIEQRASLPVVAAEPTSTDAALEQPSELMEEGEQIDFSQVLGDHAWVDDEGEMDYSFVPFSDDSPAPQTITPSVMSSGAFEPPVAAEDPVLVALKQQQQQYEEELLIERRAMEPSESYMKNLELVEMKRLEAEMKIQESLKNRPNPTPTITSQPPVINWRATSAPVYKEKPAVRKEMSRQPELDTAVSAHDHDAPLSPLDILIRSVKKAAAVHQAAESPAADTAVQVKIPSPPPRHYTIKPRPKTEHSDDHNRVLSARSITFRLYPDRPPIHTTYTVPRDRKTPTTQRLPLVDFTRLSFSISALGIANR